MGQTPSVAQDVTDDPNPVSVLGRAFLLLESFRGDAEKFTLAELMYKTGLPKTTVYRLANELARGGVLERTNGRYQLGLRVFELGEFVPRIRGLREAAAPVMRELGEATGSMVRLSVLDGADVLFIKTFGTHGLSVPSKQIYPRAPTHATASGKVMLAFATDDSLKKVVTGRLARCTPYTITVADVLLRELHAIRSCGFAVDREEARVGLAAVAAPIFLSTRRLVGALSITGRVSSFDPDRRGMAVRAAASRIGDSLTRGSVRARIRSRRRLRHLSGRCCPAEDPSSPRLRRRSVFQLPQTDSHTQELRERTLGTRRTRAARHRSRPRAGWIAGVRSHHCPEGLQTSAQQARNRVLPSG